MTRPLILATNARKARRQGCCALCGRLIRVGDREARLPADGNGYAGWAHVDCVVAANRSKVRPEPREGTTKGSTT